MLWASAPCPVRAWWRRTSRTAPRRGSAKLAHPGERPSLVAASAASSPSEAKGGSQQHWSHIKQVVGGCVALGFTEVFGSPRGGDFAVEVTSIVASLGSAIPERPRRGDVGQRSLSSPRSELRVATSTAALIEQQADRSRA